jgi:antitoxin component of RelBE/YafQ-DinJ toxin-antitoxin module
VKNITVALDDETYRRARIVAAQRDVSVSALVKRFLVSVAKETAAPRNLREEQESLLNSIWARHAGFSASENFLRDALHEHRSLR